MSALEQVLLMVVARSPKLRHELQRWALRYAGRRLGRFGAHHLPSADLLIMLGEADALIEGRGHTLVGRVGLADRRRQAATVKIPEPRR